jgi:hypothetical protein
LPRFPPTCNPQPESILQQVCLRRCTGHLELLYVKGWCPSPRKVHPGYVEGVEEKVRVTGCLLTSGSRIFRPEYDDFLTHCCCVLKIILRAFSLNPVIYFKLGNTCQVSYWLANYHCRCEDQPTIQCQLTSFLCSMISCLFF